MAYVGPDPHQPPPIDMPAARAVVERLRARLRHAVLGRDDVIDLVIIALLADGHVLLEDFPGSGKTTLAKALGAALADEAEEDGFAPLRRIQFTPDMLPSDITGTTVFDPEANRFFFRPGPIFAHILLADEINRTSPKVQSALLEAMAEKQTTVDNQTHPLDELFFVIATQNPLDVAGTFPLPSPQLDRFLFKIRMTHIARDAELAVLRAATRLRRGVHSDLPKVHRSEILAARRAVENGIHVATAVREALVDIARRTREDERVLQGVSTRALVLMLPALAARALVEGRSYVSSEDVEALAVPVLGHRLELAPGVGSPASLVEELVRGPLETLARVTLQ